MSADRAARGCAARHGRILQTIGVGNWTASPSTPAATDARAIRW